MGLCTLNTDLNKTRGGLDKFSWCLNAENYVMNDGQVTYDLNEMYSTNGNGNGDDTEQLLPITKKRDVSNLLPSSSNPSQRSALPQEGDILGITYDHVELNFYLNGKNLNIPTLVKLNSQTSNGEYNNEIYPVLFVDDGAILDLVVDNFNFQIPSGYDKIMVEQTLL